MKKIVELKIEKEAILSNNDMASKGKLPVGNGTQYFGPQSFIPNYIYTYVDDDIFPLPFNDGAMNTFSQDTYNLYSSLDLKAPNSDSVASIRITSE